MAFTDHYRVGAHAVIVDSDGKILQLKSTYGDKVWSFPGGALDPGETVHEGLLRECREELGVEASVLYMSGVYFHAQYNVHACIFRCALPKEHQIMLSEEHSEYRYFNREELSEVQRIRVVDCLQFNGFVKSAKF